MALVNPQIAMSYRPTTEYQPRNALAEYAQLQSIVGAQRQAEVADMQIEDLRRERDVLGQISAAISAKGGPDIKTASLLMMRNPRTSEQGFKIYQALQQQERLDAYERGEGLVPGAAPASAPSAILGGGAPAAAVPAAAPVVAPAAAVPRSGMAKEIFEEYGEDAAKFFEANKYLPAGMFTRLADQQQGRGISREEYATARNQFRNALRAQGVNVDAPEFNIQPPPASDMAGEFRRDMEARGIRMAPAAAPAGATNVLAAQQGATPPQNVNQFAAAGAAPNIDDLRRRYNLASRAGSPDAAVFLKQIEAALKTTPDPAELRTMEVLGYPRTPEGYAAFRGAQMRENQPGAPIAVIGPDGKPRYVTREQAIGLTPFTPAAVQVLGMGPGREPTAAARQPAGAAGAAGAPQPRPLTAAQEAARRDKLGKEFKSATAALQTTQDVLDSISFVRAEPGLSRATGFTGTFLPSFPEGAAASAETRLKNLEGKVTALGKAQAAATGAIGSIANQEWQILRDQIAAIDRTKGTGPLLKQLELVELQAKGAMARIQDAYQRQFGEDFERFPQFSNLPPPQSSFRPSAAPGAAPGGGGVDSTNPLLR